MCWGRQIELLLQRHGFAAAKLACRTRSEDTRIGKSFRYSAVPDGYKESKKGPIRMGRLAYRLRVTITATM